MSDTEHITFLNQTIDDLNSEITRQVGKAFQWEVIATQLAEAHELEAACHNEHPRCSLLEKFHAMKDTQS